MKNTIKITKAGYLYINNVKQSNLRVTPLNIHKISRNPEILEEMRKYNEKNFKMV